MLLNISQEPFPHLVGINLISMNQSMKVRSD